MLSGRWMAVSIAGVLWQAVRLIRECRGQCFAGSELDLRVTGLRKRLWWPAQPRRTEPSGHEEAYPDTVRTAAGETEGSVVGPAAAAPPQSVAAMARPRPFAGVPAAGALKL